MPLRYCRMDKVCSVKRKQKIFCVKNGRFPHHFNKKRKDLRRGLFFFGRDDRIRTCGLCVPNATLYQAEPHPVIKIFYHIFIHLSTDYGSVLFPQALLLPMLHNASTSFFISSVVLYGPTLILTAPDFHVPILLCARPAQ